MSLIRHPSWCNGIDVCSHHSNTPHRWTWWIEERIAIWVRSPTEHKHDSHIFNFSFWGIYKLSWSWSHGSFRFTTTHAIQGRSYPKMKCTQICLKVWWRVTSRGGLTEGWWMQSNCYAFLYPSCSSVWRVTMVWTDINAQLHRNRTNCNVLL
jgi:hypothetical protein